MSRQFPCLRRTGQCSDCSPGAAVRYTSPFADRIFVRRDELNHWSVQAADRTTQRFGGSEPAGSLDGAPGCCEKWRADDTDHGARRSSHRARTWLTGHWCLDQQCALEPVLFTALSAAAARALGAGVGIQCGCVPSRKIRSERKAGV